jgi:simple sugar transport system permease protein
MRQLWTTVQTPLLSVLTALALGGVVMAVSSGSVRTVGQAYGGLFEGALLKPSGLSESLVATVPYVFSSLAVALAFQAGLFNIGVEGQFQIGALCAAWAGVAVAGLPPIFHLPLTLLAAAAGGAIWGAIPGVLKVKTGAHEVINTIMMNYVAFRLVEYLVSGPLRDPNATTVQTARVSRSAELPTFAQLLPFWNPHDRLHVGLFLAIVAAVTVWWLLRRTTIGFELKTVGRNPAAAQFGGMNIGRTVVVAMAMAGALAGIGGAVEVLGVSTCRCLPQVFSSGYGFDSIAVALLARVHPLGIVPASFLFGAMRNGADLMELRSGVSKHIIAVIQAIVLLLVAAPSIVRWLFRLKDRNGESANQRNGETANLRPHPQTRRRWLTALFGIMVATAFVAIARLNVGSQSGEEFLTQTLAQALRVGVPIALAAFCGLLCERAGVINIGIEGMMLTSAMTAYAVNIFAFAALKQSGMSEADAANLSRLLGLFSALTASGLLALLHGGVSISLKADQIISGTVINLLAIGLTGFFYRQFLAEGAPPSPGAFAPFDVPLLSSLPVVGAILFQAQKPIACAMLVLALWLHYVLFRSVWGLRLRAVGEHPQAADTSGISVQRMRYLNVIAGGIVAGLAGAWFTLESVDIFQPLMTNGLGFVGLAAMIFGRWSPLGALLGAFVFGLGSSLQTTVAILYPHIPSQLPQMLPYVLTMTILAGVVGRATPPAGLGRAYPHDG